MNVETERRFLIEEHSDIFGLQFLDRFLYKANPISAQKIDQYYFKNNTTEISQRVRKTEFESNHKCEYTLNIKSNIDTISRHEFEQIISKEDFEFISQHYCNKVLTKYRFKFLVNQKTWEINFVQNMIIAEIELKSSKEELVIPFKFLKEITYDKKYLAENLALEF